MALEQDAKDFLLAEYSALRSNFQSHVGQIVTDQQLGLAVTGAFWTWVATHKVDWGLHYLVWIPAALCVLFFLKWLVFHFSLMRLSRYLKTVEEKFGLPRGAGWSSNYKTYGRDLFAPTTTCFWIVVILANTVIACIVPLTPFAVETNT